LQARNSIGYGPFSDEFVFLAGEVPARPDAPLVRVTEKSLEIKWQLPDSNGDIIDYQIDLIKAFNTGDQKIELDACENGSIFYVMRDRHCALSLETLNSVYDLENEEITVSVSASNSVGASETSWESDSVTIPRIREPSIWDNTIGQPVAYQAPTIY